MPIGEMERTLAIVFKQTAAQTDTARGGGSSGDGTSTPSGDSDSKDKKDDKKEKKTSLKKLIGIDLSLVAMLKQSQIFTGFLGSVFQLMGMLIDVVLAPLAPYLFKVVELVSGWIPKIGEWSKKAVEWLIDVFNAIVGIADKLPDTDIKAPDLVEQGFKIMSISGLGALVGQEFAIKFKGIGFNPKNWRFSDLFEAIPETDVVEDVKKPFKQGSKGHLAIKALFSGLTKGISFDWVGKFAGIIGKGAKALGMIGMLIGIPIAIADIMGAFKEGRIGEGIVKLVMNLLAFGIPVVIGILTAGTVGLPAIIAGIIIGVAFLLWELLVPDSVKQSIYDFVGKLFEEMKDVLGDIFSFDSSNGIFGMVISLLKGLMTAPVKLMIGAISMFMTEDVKRTINSGVRSLAESLVNMLIGLINGIISFAMENLVPREINFMGQKWTLPQMHDFQIAEADFSGFNLMMGTDNPSAHAGTDLGMAGNMAMYTGG
tara:strand:- start:3686 stop:5137 length:1452 start_codon:yes stop_codon:yes gene_type:complete